MFPIKIVFLVFFCYLAWDVSFFVICLWSCHSTYLSLSLSSLSLSPPISLSLSLSLYVYNIYIYLSFSITRPRLSPTRWLMMRSTTSATLSTPRRRASTPLSHHPGNITWYIAESCPPRCPTREGQPQPPLFHHPPIIIIVRGGCLLLINQHWRSFCSINSSSCRGGCSFIIG